MQEQTSNPFPVPRQPSDSLHEELLLSPTQKMNLVEQGPTLQTLTGSIPLQQFYLPQSTNQDKKLDDSLLLSANVKEDSAGLNSSINAFQIQSRSHQQMAYPQQQTLIQQENDLREQKTPSEKEVTLLQEIQVHQQKRKSLDPQVSQHQTTFQSNNNFNHTHISTNFVNQLKQTSPSRIFSSKKSNLKLNGTQLLQSANPSQKLSIQRHLQHREPPLIQQSDQITCSQQHLLGLLSSFTHKLLQNRQEQIYLHQNAVPEHQSTTFQRDDLPSETDEEAKDHVQTSMIVNYSDEKGPRESFKEGHFQEVIANQIEPKLTQQSEPMQIQQVVFNDKTSYEPPQQIDHCNHNQVHSIPMEIEIQFSKRKSNAEEIYQQTLADEDRNHFQITGQSNHRPQSSDVQPLKMTRVHQEQNPETNKFYEFDKINDSRSQHQQIGQQNHADLNESRNFSIEVNVNQDSLPQCLQKSMESVKATPLPIQIDQPNQPLHQFYTNSQLNSAFCLQPTDNFQQLKTMKLNYNDYHSRSPDSFKHSTDHLSEMFQQPQVQIKSQLDHEQSNHLNIKTDHSSAYQGVIEVINLDRSTLQYPLKVLPSIEENESQLQQCKVLNQSSTRRDRSLESAAIDNNNQSLLSPRHQISANYSEDPSIEPHRSFSDHDPHSIEGQSQFVINRQQQKQTNQPHILDDIERRQTQRKDVDVQQIKQENTFKKAPLPMVPPCITININRNHQISLNIYNNHPFVPQTHPAKPLQPVLPKEDKSVQNGSNLISNSSTIVQETIPISSTTRKIEIKKERRFTSNASIDLEKQPEVQGQKNIELDLQPLPITNNAHPQSSPFPQNTNECATIKTSENIEQQIYSQICQQAEKYLLNSNPDQATHLSFQELLKPHISPRLSTEPITAVGNLLFKNGLILVSIVKLFVRQTKSPFLANYIFEHFSSAFSVQQSKYLFQEKAKKAKEQYVNYLDQQYQDVYIKNREFNRQKGEKNSSESAIKRISIKQSTDNQSTIQNVSVQKAKKLMLNSNFYSLSERPLPDPLKEAKNMQKQSSDNHSKHRKQGSVIQNVIFQSNEKSSQSSIEVDRRDYPKKSIEKPYSSMNRDRQNSSNLLYKAAIDVSKQPARVEQLQTESITKSRVVDNNQQLSQCKFVEHQNLVSAQMPGARFDELYKRYKKIRESIRVSGSVKTQEPSGILKPSSSESKERPGEVDNKKKKNVQFLDDPIESKQHSNGEEAPTRKNKKKKTKPKVQSSLEEGTEEVTTRNRASKR